MTYAHHTLEPGTHWLIETAVGVIEINLSQQQSLSVSVSVKETADMIANQYYPAISDGALESWHVRLAAKPGVSQEVKHE